MIPDAKSIKDSGSCKCFLKNLKNTLNLSSISTSFVPKILILDSTSFLVKPRSEVFQFIKNFLYGLLCPNVYVCNLHTTFILSQYIW